jgi:starch synthase/alpha-amylase
MSTQSPNPRILIVTPEVTYLPPGMGNLSNYFSVKAGGVADVSASLIKALFEQGVDVHVALPDYRRIFNRKLPPILRRELDTLRNEFPDDRIHLAEDRGFFYLDHIPYGGASENTKVAVTFQREILNNIVPRVQPDLIHCNDWMTGLIPAMTRKLAIPCLFTIHNIHTTKCSLSYIEDIGVDAAIFWQNLFYDHYPLSYEQSRESNLVDFLSSGIYSAHFVNTVSPTFLMEMIKGRHTWISVPFRQELASKWEVGCAVGILNAPDPSFNPMLDEGLFLKFNSKDHHTAKQMNKLFLQEKLGLITDAEAPVFFWPSRLDPFQKGCQLVAEILDKVIHRYWDQHLQIVFVANGEFKGKFEDIVSLHQLQKRVAVCDFDEQLARLSYGASNFVLMPSRFEPCGLPQMIGPVYGALPVAHDTGGLHDTVMQMDVGKDTGNGFLFDDYDAEGLFEAINEAVRFYYLPQELKNRQIERIMTECMANFNHQITASKYIKLYEKMLQRPLIN